MNKLISIAFILMLPLLALGQIRMRDADQALKEGNYPKAYYIYEQLALRDTTNTAALYGYAVSAYHLEKFGQAQKGFQKAFDQTDAAEYPELLLWTGKAAIRGGHYEDGLRSLERFKSQGKEDTQRMTEADEWIERAQWALEAVQNPDSLDISHLNSLVNSTNSDLAPVWHNGSLFFTSFWVEPERARDTALRIFRYDEGAPQSMMIAGNPEDPDLHLGHYSVNPTGTHIYVTYCEGDAVNKYHCRIALWDQEADGKETILPAPVNLPSYTNSHPATGLNSAGQELLFFASDRPAFEGDTLRDMNIWYTLSKPDGGYYDPVLVREITTDGDEVTPFFHTPSQTLFFSSDGQPGLGGFDIYKISLLGIGEFEPGRPYDWSPAAQHTGYPLNSSYDDLYYSFNSEIQKAFWTSDKPGCICPEIDTSCVCSDIYEYPIAVTLETDVRNGCNEEPLDQVNIRLIDLGIDSVELDTLVNARTGKISLRLEKNYRVIASKSHPEPGVGWISDTLSVSTKGIFKPRHFRETLRLQPRVKLEVATFDKITREPLNGVIVSLAEPGPVPNALLLENETGNLFEFGIRSDKAYLLSGERENYRKSETMQVRSGCQPGIIKEKLYLFPFDSIVLYFYNAIPPRHDYNLPVLQDTFTPLTYSETFQGTDRLRGYKTYEKEFIQAYTRGKPAKQDLEIAVEEFFREVNRNAERLESYTSILWKYLYETNPRDTFLITVEGYTSPLGSPEYNESLSKRRIKSIENAFRNYSRNGKSLGDQLGKQLIIVERPYGEQKAPKDMPDTRANLDSIYSPRASSERSVRILSIVWKPSR